MLRNEIYQQYTNSFNQLTERTQFHWLLRNALWFKSKPEKRALRQFEPLTHRSNTKQTITFYKHSHAAALEHLDDQFNRSEKLDAARVKIKREYINLLAFERVLFKSLYATRVFGVDTRDALLDIVSKKDVIQMREHLFANPEHVAILSTPAVNFFALSSWAYKLPTIPAKTFLEIAERYTDTKDRHSVSRAIYLLTHVVIGDTFFYTRRLHQKRSDFKPLVRYVDELILKRYKKIKLDAKFEAIVASKLCGSTLKSRKQILEEALQSVGKDGFLIDRLNQYKGETPTDLSNSEHRNLLYLMASQKTPTHLQPKSLKR